MSDKSFNPEYSNRLGSAEASFDDLSMAVAGLRSVLYKPGDEVDASELQAMVGLTLPYVKEARDYFGRYTEHYVVPVAIDKDEVLETRCRLIEAIRQKGSASPTSIGVGWRQSVYGKRFKDQSLGRGVELWYPGITQPTPNSKLDNPVHLTVIEAPEVDHEPRRLSLTADGRAASSVNTDHNAPDTKAWLETVAAMQANEWSALLQTTLDELQATN